MGDRTTTILPCPKCGKESEQYDAPSSLIWNWDCEHCGWKDDKHYYEGKNNTIWLLTKKEARKKKLISDCPKCKKIMTWWEKEKIEVCIDCEEVNKWEK